MPIPAWETAAFQADAAAALLDKTCTIQRATRASDGHLHKIATYGAIATGVACNLTRPTANMLAVIGGKVSGLSAWDISFLAAQDVQEGDRIIVGGLTLEVQAVSTPESFLVLKHALASAVQ